MKKLLGILIACLLLSGNAYAGWFDKDKITVTECWDPSKYKNYKEDNKDSKRQGVTKWEWELNLKEKIAYRIMEKKGKLTIDQFKIKASTDDYIIVHEPLGLGDFQFDLENEAYITSILDINVQALCDFD